MTYFVLTDSNFLLFASKSYTNPVCLNLKEFHSDLRRIRYIHRLICKYEKTGDIKERLMLNHLISFYNYFDVESATKMLFFKLPEKYWPQLKTFLLYLNYMPTHIHNIRTSPVDSSRIMIDFTIVEKLRNI
ncbi:hypothetical protein EBU71_07225 [bacterium]|jgi:hypothetical protein|nr:hypothetical protein [Candidatus Elulimicrobium humile]